MTQQSHSQAYTLRKPKLKETHVPQCSLQHFTIAKTWKQPRCPSTDEWIKKLLYVCTMEYYSAIKRNTSESVLMSWMNRESIIQSEVSQKEKDKYHILTHIYRIQKNGTEEFIYRQQLRNRHREQTYGHGQRGGEGEMYGKSNVETYMTIHNVSANGNVLYGSRNSNRGSVSTQRVEMGREMGGSFKRERTHVYLWLIHVEV